MTAVQAPSPTPFRDALERDPRLLELDGVAAAMLVTLRLGIETDSGSPNMLDTLDALVDRLVAIEHGDVKR